MSKTKDVMKKNQPQYFSDHFKIDKANCIGYGLDSINGSGSGAYLNDKILQSANLKDHQEWLLGRDSNPRPIG